MEIMIEIPDFIYTEIRNITNTGIIEHNAKTLYNVIYHGKSLPKHHGRLIDADTLIEKAPEIQEYLDVLAPTIIEADKCTYIETGCGSCKRQLDCPIEAEGG